MSLRDRRRTEWAHRRGSRPPGWRVLLGAPVRLLFQKNGGVKVLALMVGIAAVIYLLAWNVTPGRAYLNGDDVLAKTILIAVAAWFAPDGRSPPGGVAPVSAAAHPTRAV